MSFKESLTSLTLVFLLMPVSASNPSVKDILNYFESCPSEHYVHSRSVMTKVDHITFEEHRYDGKNIIVIDAGHGGYDSGARGKNSFEKDIALSIALQLGETLKNEDNQLIIKYTRTEDVFIPLHERIKKANAAKADLFISIHCNYVDNPDVCGTETFVMGLHRAEENLAVAKRENSSVLLENEYEANYEGYDPNSPVGHILLSMFQNVFLDHSIALASNVEENLVGRKQTKSRGVKQAGFVVLRQATMPSVLIETGFLSNPKEEKYLLSKTGQNEMASAIGKGVISYFDENRHHENLNKVSKTDESSLEKEKYVIQIGAYSKPLGNVIEDQLKTQGTVIRTIEKGLYRYSIGYYTSREKAQASLEKIRTNGFKDAFVRVFEKQQS